MSENSCVQGINITTSNMKKYIYGGYEKNDVTGQIALYTWIYMDMKTTKYEFRSRLYREIIVQSKHTLRWHIFRLSSVRVRNCHQIYRLLLLAHKNSNCLM